MRFWLCAEGLSMRGTRTRRPKAHNQKRIQDVAVYPPRPRTTTATMKSPPTLDGGVFAERTQALFGVTTLVISAQIIYIMTK